MRRRWRLLRRESDGPGCADVSCCQMICELDPYCCEVRWDEYCVMAATFYCEPCMPGPKVVVTFGSRDRTARRHRRRAVRPRPVQPRDRRVERVVPPRRECRHRWPRRRQSSIMSDGDLLINLTSSGSLEGLAGHTVRDLVHPQRHPAIHADAARRRDRGKLVVLLRRQRRRTLVELHGDPGAGPAR